MASDMRSLKAAKAAIESLSEALNGLNHEGMGDSYRRDEAWRSAWEGVDICRRYINVRLQGEVESAIEADKAAHYMWMRR